MTVPRHAAALLLLAVLSSTACRTADADDCVSAAGPTAAHPRTVPAFSGVGSRGSFDVRLTQGETRAVTVHAPPAIAALITTEVKDGTLTIESRRCLAGRSTVRVDVTAPRFDEIALAGSGDITATTPLRTDRLGLALAGSGQIELDVATARTSVAVSGSGDVTLRGSAPDLSVDVAGSGDVDARQLATATAQVNLAGSGDVRLRADRTLAATIAGSGDVLYTGSPTVTRKVVGSGEVRPAR